MLGSSACHPARHADRQADVSASRGRVAATIRRRRVLAIPSAALSCLLVLCSAVLARGATPEFSQQSLEFFEREVRPLLVRRCYACHSDRLPEPKGGLRLDSRRRLLAGGDTGPAIVPKDPAESLLIDAINYGDLYQMPPKTRLPAREIQILTKWIELGAPWPAEAEALGEEPPQFDLRGRQEAHWCWQPPQEPDLPAVRNREWTLQEFDAFILARLEAEGLTPGTRANKRVLVRRAHFDLLGLPPSPAAVEAFVADGSPRAFETLVDSLLDSPHFGERWARHWLDLVRYAETHGHEFDYPIAHAYKYRDYIIRALNDDVPYDRWVLEHIAGDLLDPPRLHPTLGFNESVIGTGFWWLGEATHAPVDVRDDEARRIDNQIDVLSKTFLGLTVACARCHDHKFDAITTKDYYALAGFLQSSHRQEAILDPAGSIERTARRVEQLRAEGGQHLAEHVTALSAEAFTRHLSAAWHQREPSDPAGEQAAGTSAEVVARWAAALQDRKLREIDHPLHAWFLLRDRGAATSTAVEQVRRELAEAAEEAERTNAELPLVADFDHGFDNWFVTGQAFGEHPTRSLEWDAASDDARFYRPGLAHSGRTASRLQGVLRSPTFTLTHPNIFYRISGTGAQVRVIVDGYFMDVFNALLFKGFAFDVSTEGEFVWRRQAQDLGRYVGHRVHLEIIDHDDGSVAVDEVRLSNGQAPRTLPSSISRFVLSHKIESPADLAAAYGRSWKQALAAIRQQRANSEQVDLINWALSHRLITGQQARVQLDDCRDRLRREVAGLPAADRVLAMGDGSAENERVFVRGNHRTLGPEVPRRLLQALGGQAVTHQGSGRLELARQIIDPENPLVARVMVNRLWHHLFGRGLVPSVDNFGVLGQRPTHPELLDYLARRFVEDGWSIKRMIRRMMLSSTYQLASDIEPTAAEVDPQNLYWQRMPIRRLEGESIRDAMLSLSGRLDRTMYGPSVPVHITDFMQGRGRPKKSGPADGRGRRSLYLEVRRNFLNPMMLAFDAPIPFNTIGRRNRSNVPAQALTLMNDPFVIEQAAEWSARLLAQGLTPTATIEQMYLAAFARPPTPQEIDESISFLQQQARELDVADNDPRVWADLAHVLWNVKEFIYLK